MYRNFFVFDLMDEYSNIVKSNNGSTLSITIGDGELNTVFVGDTSWQSINGCTNFTHF